MKNRGLVTLISALIIGLFATPAFAEAEEEETPEKANPTPARLASESVAGRPPIAKSGAGKEEKAHKPPRNPIASCGLYSNVKYLTGEFSGSESSDQFVRKGLGLGASCNYSNRSRLSLGVGAEFYLGKFLLNHEEDSLKGSASYLEVGFKEWLSATLNLNDVKIGALVGMERTNSSRFRVNSAQANFGGGWLNLTKFAAEHLSSSGELEIWEAGLDVRFPFHRNFSVTFGGLWQRYQVVVRLKLDDEGRDALEALNYNVKNIEKDFKRSADFFYLTPGVKWCKKELCVSLTVPWGVFTANNWLWGTVLGTELQF